MIQDSFKTDLHRLHCVANNIPNVERGEGKTFLDCHNVSSIIALAKENNEKDVLIVIMAERYQINHIKFLLSNILKENNDIEIVFSKLTNVYGLIDIDKDIKIKFAKNENDLIAYSDYYVVDMRDSNFNDC